MCNFAEVIKNRNKKFQMQMRLYFWGDQCTVLVFTHNNDNFVDNQLALF